jgi:hypothetical protein
MRETAQASILSLNGSNDDAREYRDYPDTTSNSHSNHNTNTRSGLRYNLAEDESTTDFGNHDALLIHPRPRADGRF